MTATAMTAGEAPVVTNGVDVTALFDVIDLLKQQPEVGAFRFRAANRWIDGGRNRSTIDGFYGAGEEHAREKPFVFDNDEPPVLLGEDKGANPVEFILHALAGCMTTTMVYHAAARGLGIGAVETQLEGDLDIRGFTGVSPEVRSGYQRIRATMRVKSEASPKILKQLAQHSPVFDVVSNSVPVDLVVETY